MQKFGWLLLLVAAISLKVNAAAPFNYSVYNVTSAYAPISDKVAQVKACNDEWGFVGLMTVARSQGVSIALDRSFFSTDEPLLFWSEDTVVPSRGNAFDPYVYALGPMRNPAIAGMVLIEGGQFRFPTQDGNVRVICARARPAY